MACKLVTLPDDILINISRCLASPLMRQPVFYLSITCRPLFYLLCSWVDADRRKHSCVVALCTKVGIGLKQIGTTLEVLDLKYMSINTTELALVSDIASTGALINLKELDLRGNGLGCDAITSIASCLTLLSQLQSLWLGYNSLKADGARMLLNCPGNITELCLLDWACNCIGDTGLGHLSIGLSIGAFPNLLHLDLLNNEISDHGVLHLSAAFKAGASPQLIWLFLDENLICDSGVLLLSSVLCAGNLENMCEICLNGNPELSEEGLKSVAFHGVFTHPFL
jgi:Ran GTPase-activating protein (RanGAP) involved in mRNA processing and transport